MQTAAGGCGLRAEAGWCIVASPDEHPVRTIRTFSENPPGQPVALQCPERPGRGVGPAAEFVRQFRFRRQPGPRRVFAAPDPPREHGVNVRVGPRGLPRIIQTSHTGSVTAQPQRTPCGFDVARRIWNGHVQRRPALIARCQGAADVMAAVRFCRDHVTPKPYAAHQKMFDAAYPQRPALLLEVPQARFLRAAEPESGRAKNEMGSPAQTGGPGERDAHVPCPDGRTRPGNSSSGPLPQTWRFTPTALSCTLPRGPDQPVPRKSKRGSLHQTPGWSINDLRLLHAAGGGQFLPSPSAGPPTWLATCPRCTC
jgi:hypothetical protein